MWFADGSRRAAAGLSTDRAVVRLVTPTLDPGPSESVCDPTCGSGGMLLRAVAELRRRGRGVRERAAVREGAKADYIRKHSSGQTRDCTDSRMSGSWAETRSRTRGSEEGLRRRGGAPVGREIATILLPLVAVAGVAPCPRRQPGRALTTYAHDPRALPRVRSRQTYGQAHSPCYWACPLPSGRSCHDRTITHVVSATIRRSKPTST